MATIKTLVTTIRTAPSALSLDEINAKLRAAGHRPSTQVGIKNAVDLGYIVESTKPGKRGKYFTAKTKRAEIDGWSRATAAPTTSATRTATPKPHNASSDPDHYSAVQKGVLLALRDATHGIKGEDLNLVALTNLEAMGIVRKDKRDTRLSSASARWFVRKDARSKVDEMLVDAAESL